MSAKESHKRDLKPWKEAAPLPQPISDVMAVFPATVVGTLLPEEDDVPEQFKKDKSGWRKLCLALFMGTPHLDRLGDVLRVRERGAGLEQLAEAGTPPPDFYMKKGVDGETAYRHLMACMGSYEPSHQHKEAGCAYLMDLWFEKVVWDGLVFDADGMRKGAVEDCE
jgi:hypothetical protein